LVSNSSIMWAKMYLKFTTLTPVWPSPRHESCFSKVLFFKFQWQEQLTDDDCLDAYLLDPIWSLNFIYTSHESSTKSNHHFDPESCCNRSFKKCFFGQCLYFSSSTMQVEHATKMCFFATKVFENMYIFWPMPLFLIFIIEGF
jgi:hypothetical protein